MRKEAPMNEPILKSFLGVKSLEDPIPNCWIEIQRYSNEKNLFALFATIFTHGEIVKDFAEKYSTVETNQSIIQHIENMMIYLEESVIAECHGSEYPNAYGLTIYFPAKKIKYNSQYSDPEYGLDFSNNTYWDEFLNTYMKTKNKSLISFSQLFQRFPNSFIQLRQLIGY